MFLRMFFVMFLTLFSTRLLLKTLGFEGYGIYDLIFGVVVLFSILSGSMATTLQRFYNVSQGDPYKQSSIYSVSLQVFSIVGLLILIFGFTFSNNIVGCLNIPIYQTYDAVVFFRLCVANLVFMIFRLPFIALLISNEKMGVYASISVFDATIKFLGVMLLGILSLNISNLIIYGCILSFISLIVTLIYIMMCYFKLDMPKLRRKVPKLYYREIFSFSGWTLFGSSATVVSQQGLSITLNIFFGVLINAANAVAQQIYTAVYQFVSSFQTAYSPYLMRTYTQQDFEKLKQLIIFFSKFSVFLYLLLAVPLFAYADAILKIWLENVPDYAVSFTRLTLIIVLFEVLSAPLWLTVQASGNIKRYQVFISIILIMNLPIAYLCFMVWEQPILAFVAKIFTSVLAYIYRIYSVSCLGCLNIKKYTLGLVCKLFLLLLVMSPVVSIFMDYQNQSILDAVLSILVIISVFIIISFFILIEKSEYKKIYDIIFNFFGKVRK
ncbi:hypothetical protein J4G44_02835 [Acinetobacter towneri]|uniref:Oligosaccharide flippase family protein n=2 Tax=Acinetobacter towneri TaxID=202956 RepID=A0ABX7TGS7_9GAMM|nr:hypothetical protein J4G44_02835 [Acinetobacter towneri]QTD62915.1 hypothetical protein J4G45_01110 [Acinetobacter towneri]